jgi:hypothetical protein
MRLIKPQIDVLKILAKGAHIEEMRSMPKFRLAFSGIETRLKIAKSTFNFFHRWGLIEKAYGNKWKISKDGTAALKKNLEPVLSVQDKTAKLMRKYFHPSYLEDLFRRPQ